MPIRLLSGLRGTSLLLSLLAVAACQRHATPAATATTCIDPAKVNPAGICPMLYDPVCGCDGKAYSNACVAERAGVRSYQKGACASSR